MSWYAGKGATSPLQGRNIGGLPILRGKWDEASLFFSTDGKNTKLGRVIFNKETKAKPGSFPKPLHRDVHLLSF